MVGPERLPHFSPEPLSEKICIAVGETEVPLSETKLRLLEEASNGATTAEVGEALGRQKEVTRTICRNLFKKLEASGRTHSVRRAYEYGIFTVY